MTNKIGIWGFGIVGKSALSHLSKKDYNISVFDKKELSKEDIDLIKKNNATYTTNSLEQFLETNDQIIVSPGIDLNPYKKYSNKWISELDLFYSLWQKPIIAITGTVGKTSLVHIFSKILEAAGHPVATGGNIGIAMLDLLKEPSKRDVALLEVSSFQLDLCKKFAPDICVWTNLFPNHLDRHCTMQEYFEAKYKIIKNQTNTQKALVNWPLREELIKRNPTRSYHFFIETKPEPDELKKLRDIDVLYALEGRAFVKYTNHKKIFIHEGDMPNISYISNWIILIALCDMQMIDVNLINSIQFDLPSHRLDHVATIRGSKFYNDSKSTIVQSTLQAVRHCTKRPLYLFLGGVSKGVDRSSLIKDLVNKVDRIFCFGHEAEFLYNVCKQFNIDACKHENLEESFNACISSINRESTVLFSPSGASFDLYKNYNERGDHFVSLVKKYQNTAGTS